MQVYNKPGCLHAGPVERVQYGATARGNYRILLQGQLSKGLGLSHTKPRLPLDLEHRRDGDSRAFLDVLIEIDELQVKLFGEPLANSRLAGPHHADKIDVRARPHPIGLESQLDGKRVIHHPWRDHDDQFGLDLTLGLLLEHEANIGKITKERNSRI